MFAAASTLRVGSLPIPAELSKQYCSAEHHDADHKNPMVIQDGNNDSSGVIRTAKTVSVGVGNGAICCDPSDAARLPARNVPKRLL
jgi:hypothetical protein